MRKVLKNWNFFRLIRLAFGFVFIGEGIHDNNWIILFLGLTFSLMAIFNVGCCAGNSCSTNSKNTAGKTEDIDYDEVY